ncbi:MAG: SDR family NAD(P)-dependent oxidoreductase [Pseudomonadota bacterium]
MDFAGKKVLVTGSTQGIGRALVQRFVAEGAAVAVNGRSRERVQGVIDELGSGALVNAAGDLNSRSGCSAVVSTAVQDLGGLDVLINNAGLFPIASIADTDEETWDRTLSTNVKAAFFCAQAALDALKKNRGTIINHGSIAGLIGLANVAAYCTSKGAIVHLTKAMAMELAPEIRVNCVCPTTVDNEMGWKGFNRSDDPEAAHDAFVAASKMKRMVTNEDVVEAFVFLASRRASFMTGVALPVDGGKSAGV